MGARGKDGARMGAREDGSTRRAQAGDVCARMQAIRRAGRAVRQANRAGEKPRRVQAVCSVVSVLCMLARRLHSIHVVTVPPPSRMEPTDQPQHRQ